MHGFFAVPEEEEEGRGPLSDEEGEEGERAGPALECPFPLFFLCLPLLCPFVLFLSWKPGGTREPYYDDGRRATSGWDSIGENVKIRPQLREQLCSCHGPSGRMQWVIKYMTQIIFIRRASRWIWKP